MKVIQIDEPVDDIAQAVRALKVVEKPIPEPGPGQVLVKISKAPCNPSDLYFLTGKYGVKKPYPAVPGWEGAGTVVGNGGGLIGWWLKGKRVACGGKSEGDGTWAEYYVADAKSCVPLNDQVSFAQGATLLINPLTAIGMLEEAIKGKHDAIIQNAALSQVGRMLQTLAVMKKIPVIHIVRREEQLEELRELGAEHLLNSSEPEFPRKLQQLAESLNATIAFDAIGGEISGTILNAMPSRSSLHVYGALEGKPCGGVSPMSLIFQGKCVKGFWLSEWIKESGMWHLLQSTRKIQQLMGSETFQTKIRQSVGPDQWKEALLGYIDCMSFGKVLLDFEEISSFESRSLSSASTAST